MYDHMRVKISRDAGFGDQIITTNPIESSNNAIKKWQDFEPKDAKSFLDDMKKLVLYQQNQCRMAFLNMKSEYSVKDEFRNLIITDHASKCAEGKANDLKKVDGYLIDKDSFKAVTGFKAKPPKPLAEVSDDSDGEALGIEEDIITVLPGNDSERVKKRAEELVENGMIISGVMGNEFLVKGSTGYRSILRTGRGCYR